MLNGQCINGFSGAALMLLKSMSLRNRAQQLLNFHVEDNIHHTERGQCSCVTVQGLDQMYLPVQIVINLADNRTAWETRNRWCQWSHRVSPIHHEDSPARQAVCRTCCRRE
jgi:hypothetical protein